ncbi:hypothetical protein [Megalodesulfovibrio paquesii]
MYTFFMLGVFLVVHKRSVEGYQRVLRHWEVKCTRLTNDNEVLLRRIEERDITVEFLRERLAEAEKVGHESMAESSS